VLEEAAREALSAEFENLDISFSKITRRPDALCLIPEGRRAFKFEGYMGMRGAATGHSRFAFPDHPRTFGEVIPSSAHQNRLAQSRRPMDMIVRGRSMSLFQAWQQWSPRYADVRS